MRLLPCPSVLFATLAAAGSLVLGARPAQAANTASDNAADPAYAGGWGSGTNGGTGFTPWVFGNNNGSGSFAGEFRGDSTYTGGAVYGDGSRIGIGNPAFGMYSDSGSTANALRSFTGGALSVGQTFNLAMANGYSNKGAVLGFQLLTATDLTKVGSGGDPAAPRFQFTFPGGSANYRINGEPGGTEQQTAKAFTDNGMSTSFTLTGTDSFSFTVTFNDGGTESFTGTLGGTAGDTIDGFRLLDFSAGGGSQNDLFFNNFSLTGAAVPEPATVFGGLLLSGVCVARLTRYRRSRRTPRTG